MRSFLKVIKSGGGGEGEVRVITIQETESYQTLIFPRTFESINIRNEQAYELKVSKRRRDPPIW